MLTLPDPWQKMPRCSAECEHNTDEGCTNMQLATMADCIHYTAVCAGCGDPDEGCAGCRNYKEPQHAT